MMKQWQSTPVSVSTLAMSVVTVGASLALSAIDANAGQGRFPLETAAVMAPLDITSSSQMTDFDRMLGEARAAGADTVSVDVWWGKVEGQGDQQFNWSYYDDVFGRIVNHGMKVGPILSFHKCGQGPTDLCNIPLPGWLYNKFTANGLSASDLKYLSENGVEHDDALVPWATDTPAVLQQYREFMNAFAAHYGSQANNFTEVNISLGPTGELRYPAYNQDADAWTFPHRGYFQSYSTLAGNKFREWVLAKYSNLAGVNQAWSMNLQSVAEIRVPGGHKSVSERNKAQSFVDAKQYQTMKYGKDFIDWYNGSLVKHGRSLLTQAAQAFSGSLASVPLAMKLPGVHWQVLDCSPNPRIAELTAGLVQSSVNLSGSDAARPDAYGYKAILDMVRDVKMQTGHDIVLHFTAVEMSNSTSCGGATSPNSGAMALVFWISYGAQDRGLTHKSENALPCVANAGDRNWGNIRNDYIYAYYKGFNLLRLDNALSCGQRGAWDYDKDSFSSFVRDFR